MSALRFLLKSARLGLMISSLKRQIVYSSLDHDHIIRLLITET